MEEAPWEMGEVREADCSAPEVRPATLPLRPEQHVQSVEEKFNKLIFFE
jgi:hypothetical protein